MLKKNRDLIEYLVHERACNSEIVKIMGQIDRSLFLPLENQHAELSLSPIPIGYGQTMSAPFIVASMTELLEISAGDKVLEIGSGCGYQTAVLILMGANVYSIEYVPELVNFGLLNLGKIGLNGNIVCGDGYYGRPDHAPYDKIIIAATLPKIPHLLIDQLKEDGWMVMPMEKDNKQFMVKARKKNGKMEIEWLYGVRFVPFVGEIRS